MRKVITLGLVGARGFGERYLSSITEKYHEHEVILKAIIDIEPIEMHGELITMNTQYYPSLEAFYAKDTVDIMIICSPIQFHKSQSIYAMQHGSHVLCEKPVAAFMQDMHAMQAVSKETNRLCVIGFQHTFNPAMRALKQDLVQGVYGKPLEFKTRYMHNRSMAYYTRNNWAGKLKNRQGDYIMDNLVFNGSAHYLNNMFYLLGETMNQEGVLVDLEAELYRVNDIETFDTAFLRFKTDKGVKILYSASHATQTHQMDYSVLTCEHATIVKSYAMLANKYQPTLEAYDKNGTLLRSYGDPQEQEMTKVWTMVNALRGDKTDLYTVFDACAHMQVSNALIQCVPIHTIDETYKRQATFSDGDVLHYGWEFTNVIFRSFDTFLLPSEMQIPWAKPLTHVDIMSYKTFDGEYQ